MAGPAVLIHLLDSLSVEELFTVVQKVNTAMARIVKGYLRNKVRVVFLEETKQELAQAILPLLSTSLQSLVFPSTMDPNNGASRSSITTLLERCSESIRELRNFPMCYEMTPYLLKCLGLTTLLPEPQKRLEP